MNDLNASVSNDSIAQLLGDLTGMAIMTNDARAAFWSTSPKPDGYRPDTDALTVMEDLKRRGAVTDYTTDGGNFLVSATNINKQELGTAYTEAFQPMADKLSHVVGMKLSIDPANGTLVGTLDNATPAQVDDIHAAVHSLKHYGANKNIIGWGGIKVNGETADLDYPSPAKSEGGKIEFEFLPGFVNRKAIKDLSPEAFDQTVTQITHAPRQQTLQQ